jgi:hypothetical protein
VLPNQPPVVNSFTANPSSVVVCPRDPSQAVPTNSQVQLTTNASDPDGDTLLYTYSVTGGRIVGEGPNVSWDLSGVQPGTYTSTVEVDDGCGCVAFFDDCQRHRVPDCDTASYCVSDHYGQLPDGTDGSWYADHLHRERQRRYGWRNADLQLTVSAGTISGGQGTPSITVDTANLAGQSITATVNVGGLAASCPASASFNIVNRSAKHSSGEV